MVRIQGMDGAGVDVKLLLGGSRRLQNFPAD
jgi:hypothetical protein